MKTKIIFLTILLSLIKLNNCSKAQTVTDIDGNVYNTVTIGTQTWMKENLKVTKYRNGDAIPTTTSTSIPNDSTSKYQWAYNNDNNNVSIYGLLYTWWAVTDSRNVCPTGWHLPSDAEWHTLVLSLDAGSQLVNGSESSTAGGKIKEAGTSHWFSPNTGADNSSGFSALPGGYRGTDGSFGNLSYAANFISATEDNASWVWSRFLSYDFDDLIRTNGNSKLYGFSVRCVRDSSTNGLNESIKDKQFKLYPNPCDSKFNILIANITTDKIVVEIYNLMGVNVLQQETSNEIDLSKFSKGIYFVKLCDGTKIYNQKIVLQ